MPAIVVKATSVGDAYRLRADLRRGGTTAVFPAEIPLDLYSTFGRCARCPGDDLDRRSGAGGCRSAARGVRQCSLRAGGSSRMLRALGASRSFVFALVWCQVDDDDRGRCGCSGLGTGMGRGASYLAHRRGAHRASLVAAAIARPELAMVLALMLVGALLAVVPGVLSYRQPVAEGLRGLRPDTRRRAGV